MSADNLNEHRHGTDLVNQILQVLDEYLGTGSSSPRLTRIASRTGMAVGQKKLNIEKAKELREGLLALKDTGNEDVMFESAHQKLIDITDELSLLPLKQKSTTLLPNLNRILEAVEENYGNDYNRIKSNIAMETAEKSNSNLKGLNVFNDAINVTPDPSKTKMDLARSQTRIYIDGVTLPDMIKQDIENSSSSIETLQSKWKEDKNDIQKELIDDVMPLLHQNGVLFRAGNNVLDELREAHMLGSPTRETHIVMDDKGFYFTETYTFNQLMDVTAVAHAVNIQLETPLVFEHKFTVSRNDEGKLEAKTTSLQAVSILRSDTPDQEESATSGRDRRPD